jgi:putative membrane-bound dehydrogenase-like protein
MISQWSPGLRSLLKTLTGCLLLALAGAASVQAQVSAPESARRLKAAPGLEATLWAAEPMLVNPTNIDIDSRGRVWVTEGLNYRLNHGGNARFHRVEAADKIKILEDIDGDGKADKVTVFADRIFPVPMGIAVEEHHGKDGKYTGCRVFVGNSPDLLVLEDTDGDDKADKRYPLLSGFGGIDSDHGVHGMVLGPDGKLYFTQGDGCCSVQKDKSLRQQNFDVVDKSGRRVKSDQLATTLRVNRDGTQFEVICDRQRNNYETCLNSFGNIFTSDNDDDGNRGCRVIWAMDGGHYGYHTLGSPRHWGEDVPGTVPKLVGTGNGSPAGIMVYEGDLLPKEYFGGLLEADAGTRQINSFPLTRTGAGFRTEYKVLLSSDDPWFRPIDVCTAPDGSIFVADWYDAGVGGHAFSDQTTGRIFRVAPKGHKSQKVKVDFETVGGLIAALMSPNVATQDAARRRLIAEGRSSEASRAVRELAFHARVEPVYRARSLWVLHAIQGDPPVFTALMDAHRGEPRIREQAVRILGRDCRANGKVEYTKPDDRQPTSVLVQLDETLAEATAANPAQRLLLGLTADPDAGVRRELILALRNVSAEKAGDALRKLAASWDGQDRWYLEALGLALEKREGRFLARLFDGSLYGELDLTRSGRDGRVALPPYFPVDRNEAFIPAGISSQPVSPLSKSLGLAWRIHCNEVVPLLRKVLPHLKAPELQQAADDVLRRIRSADAAVLLAEMIDTERERIRKRELLSILALHLEGEGRVARNHEAVERVVRSALRDPQTRSLGIALVAASRDGRYDDVLESIAGDEKVPAEERAASVQALGEIHGPAIHFLDHLIASTSGKPHSSPMAEAAVRTVPHIYDARTKLIELITRRDFPLGLRREALNALVEQPDGGRRIIELAGEKKLPDDLKNDAVTLLLTHRDRQVRDLATTVLPVPKLAGGRPLPPFGELVRRDGDPERGRTVFFRAGQNSCASCHRVHGKGQWVGPDLSTIGTKYGKDELLRSILNPSAAIGYNFRSLVLALADGRSITGLLVEDTSERLVVKTADGQRITLRPADIEDRKTSDVSLMPEGLAGTLGDQELVDLLAFLSGLREPVSIVGQYHVVGPFSEPGGERAIHPGGKIDLAASVSGPRGEQLAWRRLDASAEGMADLTTMLSGFPSAAVYACATVQSPIQQEARLVVEARSNLTVWLGGKLATSSGPTQAASEPREVEITLPRGASTLLIRLAEEGRAAGPVTLVTTLVAASPVSFAGNEANLSVR